MVSPIIIGADMIIINLNKQASRVRHGIGSYHHRPTTSVPVDAAVKTVNKASGAEDDDHGDAHRQK